MRARLRDVYGVPCQPPHGDGLAELELHTDLLRHGRRTCHAQRPACGACALRRMCPSRAIFA